MIDFANLKTTEAEAKLISQIACKAGLLGFKRNHLYLIMDLEVCHASCPLRLDDLVKANNMDLIHDVDGIVRNLNRQTGTLENCFVPRYSAQ